MTIVRFNLSSISFNGTFPIENFYLFNILLNGTHLSVVGKELMMITIMRFVPTAAKSLYAEMATVTESLFGAKYNANAAVLATKL